MNHERDDHQDITDLTGSALESTAPPEIDSGAQLVDFIDTICA
jgi:hypothetical protein